MLLYILYIYIYMFAMGVLYDGYYHFSITQYAHINDA